MKTEEKFIEDYAEGFNDASILSCHAPEILSEILPENNPVTDYFFGFFDGKSYHQEQEQQNTLDELSTLRNRSRSRDNEYERE